MPPVHARALTPSVTPILASMLCRKENRHSGVRQRSQFSAEGQIATFTVNKIIESVIVHLESRVYRLEHKLYGSFVAKRKLCTWTLVSWPRPCLPSPLFREMGALLPPGNRFYNLYWGSICRLVRANISCSSGSGEIRWETFFSFYTNTETREIERIVRRVVLVLGSEKDP